MERGFAAELAVHTLFPAALRLAGPGRIDEHNPQDVLIFDAGKHSFHGEPLAQFYAQDILELDWARDYMMDPEVARMAVEFEDFQSIFAGEEHEVLEVYSKADLTTTESDSQWADAS
jgi:hypothetical protein